MPYQPEVRTFTSVGEAMAFIRETVPKTTLESRTEARTMLSAFGTYRLDEPCMEFAIDLVVVK